MKKKPMDLTEVLESTKAERIAERLGGELSDADERLWGSDYAASGEEKLPPPPPTFPPP